AISMFFLAAVRLCANRFGTGSALVASILSFFAYNFFFIEPTHTFTVASSHELLALTVFLLVAIITGGLSGRVREQSDAAGRRVLQTQMLFDFSRKLSGTATLDDVLWAVASQTASAIKGETTVAIERTLLVGDAARAEAAAESERLRSALLSSISHDLRTPLATILGAVTSLRSLGNKMPKMHRGELLSAIEEETRRMSRFITNILDMTRLEAPDLQIKRDWVDLGDVIRAAAGRARTAWPDRQLDL